MISDVISMLVDASNILLIISTYLATASLIVTISFAGRQCKHIIAAAI